MTIWVVEIEGRAVLAISATTRDEAEDAITPDGAIAADLMVLERPDGAAIWDGETALVLREAEVDEQVAWDNMVAAAVLDGEIGSREEAHEDGYVAYLVPVVDPTDEDFDDE
jgi:hypothetical protein